MLQNPSPTNYTLFVGEQLKTNNRKNIWVNCFRGNFGCSKHVNEKFRLKTHKSRVKYDTQNCVMSCNTYITHAAAIAYIFNFSTNFFLGYCVSTFGKNSDAKLFPCEPIKIPRRVNLYLAEFPLSDWNYKYGYCDYITPRDRRKVQLPQFLIGKIASPRISL